MSQESSEGYSTLVFRLFLSLIFIVAGLKHIIIPATVTQRLMSITFGKILGGYVYPEPLIIISGAGLFLGGLALSLGYFTRLAALGLICILIPITITVQTQGMHTLGPLFKNIGLLGGLIYFAANGSCTRSLDNKFKSVKSFT